MSKSGQLSQRCTVEPHCSDMYARLADASVTHERTLKTRKPSCVPRIAKHFFIPVIHSPLGAVAAPELSPRGGRARSHRTCESARAYLDREARPGAEGHMATAKLTSARR
jgi:hypothetical protein